MSNDAEACQRELADSAWVSRRILELAYGAGKGHIGSALSIADIITVTLDFVRGLGSQDPGRDRFVLSKGHAAMALYANLELRGIASAEEVSGYCSEGSQIATHPKAGIAGIDFSTGSLGQGITFAVGAAFAGHLARDDRRVFCVLSDSELQEGSTWEAALMAAHHQLSNLIVMLDFNGQQALGKTADVLSLTGVPDAWRSIGWTVAEVDGHDCDSIRTALEFAINSTGPQLVVAKTVAGHGVPFMEGLIEWHYRPMSDAQFDSAVQSVSGAKPR